jgi:anaerobic magnesium-protoporphyrin IX monomethyl ester cyclase
LHIQLIGVVEPKSEDGKVYRFPYGLPTVIRQLESTDHTFDVVDTHIHKKSKSELMDFLGECDAKVYGISAWSEGYKITKDMAALIRRKNPDATIIVGGILSRSDQALFENTEIDVAVTSADGHLVLPEILDSLEKGQDLSEISGISWRGPGRTRVVNPERPLMTKQQYQDSPIPAYEYFENEIRELVETVSHQGYGRGDRKAEPVAAPFPLMVTRGCPFDCTFCGFMEGQRFFRRKWEDMFDEIEYLINEFGIQNFISNDTNLCFHDRDVDAYCEQYAKRDCSFRVIGNYRPTFGSRESVKKLVEHGNVVATYGWESGSQKILDIMRKNSNVAEVIAHAWLSAKAGIIVYGNFLFGMPGEDKSTIRETAAFMMELERIMHWQKADFEERQVPYEMTSGYNYSVLIAMPTSEVFDLAVEYGMIEDMDGYLSYLDPGEQMTEEYTRQHSRYKGSDINLSDFSSKEAMIHYARYQMALVKFKAQFLGGVGSLENLRGIFNYGWEASSQYAQHTVLTVKNTLFAPETQEFIAKKSALLDRLLAGKRGFRHNDTKTKKAKEDTSTPALPAQVAVATQTDLGLSNS